MMISKAHLSCFSAGTCIVKLVDHEAADFLAKIWPCFGLYIASVCIKQGHGTSCKCTIDELDDAAAAGDDDDDDVASKFVIFHCRTM